MSCRDFSSHARVACERVSQSGRIIVGVFHLTDIGTSTYDYSSLDDASRERNAPNVLNNEVVSTKYVR